ncbi:hypothetical protein AV521_02435 [Streptomyces sp. IMTB 2501]|nr:hypothetical protein AV521_02435 [Streptomyces sp. IMTB 2501]
MYPPPRPIAEGFVRRCTTAAVRALVLVLTVAAALVFAQPGPASALTNHQIPVPAAPMGWASWNSFATDGTLLVGAQSGRCADIYNNTITNGTQAELWDCNGGANQAWTYTSRKELVVYGDKCLDAYNLGTANATKVVIWDCNGQDNQKWTLNTDGTITNVHAGLCQDAYNAATGNGTSLVLWSCDGGANQKWSRT